jgi:hypothetical protein
LLPIPIMHPRPDHAGKSHIREESDSLNAQSQRRKVLTSAPHGISERSNSRSRHISQEFQSQMKLLAPGPADTPCGNGASQFRLRQLNRVLHFLRQANGNEQAPRFATSLFCLFIYPFHATAAARRARQ